MLEAANVGIEAAGLPETGGLETEALGFPLRIDALSETADAPEAAVGVEAEAAGLTTRVRKKKRQRKRL